MPVDHPFVEANPWTPTKCRWCMIHKKAHPVIEEPTAYFVGDPEALVRNENPGANAVKPEATSTGNGKPEVTRGWLQRRRVQL